MAQPQGRKQNGCPGGGRITPLPGSLNAHGPCLHPHGYTLNLPTISCRSSAIFASAAADALISSMEANCC